jgi:hypothetical protein
MCIHAYIHTQTIHVCILTLWPSASTSPQIRPRTSIRIDTSSPRVSRKSPTPYDSRSPKNSNISPKSNVISPKLSEPGTHSGESLTPVGARSGGSDDSVHEAGARATYRDSGDRCPVRASSGALLLVLWFLAEFPGSRVRDVHGGDRARALEERVAAADAARRAAEAEAFRAKHDAEEKGHLVHALEMQVSELCVWL